MSDRMIVKEESETIDEARKYSESEWELASIFERYNEFEDIEEAGVKYAARNLREPESMFHGLDPYCPGNIAQTLFVKICSDLRLRSILIENITDALIDENEYHFIILEDDQDEDLLSEKQNLLFLKKLTGSEIKDMFDTVICCVNELYQRFNKRDFYLHEYDLNCFEVFYNRLHPTNKMKLIDLYAHEFRSMENVQACLEDLKNAIGLLTWVFGTKSRDVSMAILGANNTVVPVYGSESVSLKNLLTGDKTVILSKLFSCSEMFSDSMKLERFLKKNSHYYELILSIIEMGDHIETEIMYL